jgi:hypothetical protein
VVQPLECLVKKVLAEILTETTRSCQNGKGRDDRATQRCSPVGPVRTGSVKTLLYPKEGCDPDTVKTLLLAVAIRRDHLELQTFPAVLVEMDVFAMPLIGLEERGVVIGSFFQALEGKDGIVPRS